MMTRAVDAQLSRMNHIKHSGSRDERRLRTGRNDSLQFGFFAFRSCLPDIHDCHGGAAGCLNALVAIFEH